jgi:hypothetical protein
MKELIERLRKAAIGLGSENPRDYIPRGVSAGDCIEAADALQSLQQRLEEAREALTPSGETKVAYTGEFYWIEDLEYDGVTPGRKVYVPWTTIKEIMAAIRARAALRKAREEML